MMDMGDHKCLRTAILL